MEKVKKVEKMKEEKIILGAIVVLAVIWIVSVFSNFNKKEEIVYTRSDIQAIETAMDQFGDDITVTKDKKGNLILNIGQTGN